MSSPEILPQVLSRFPPPDLCDTLIRLYFQHVNSQFPLLHRPTFERQWQQSLHERNAWFACLVMTLFSVASRWCDDLRVLPKSTTKQENGDIDWTRAGWDYFEVAVGVFSLNSADVPLTGRRYTPTSSKSYLSCYIVRDSGIFRQCLDPWHFRHGCSLLIS